MRGYPPLCCGCCDWSQRSGELLLRLLLTSPSRPISYMELANRVAFWHDTFFTLWSCGHFRQRVQFHLPFWRYLTPFPHVLCLKLSLLSPSSGFNGTRALKDFWQLNLATNTWTDLVSVTAAPQSEVHSTANWQDTFTRIWYVFGGRASSGNTNQFLSFNLGTANPRTSRPLTLQSQTGFLHETKVVEGHVGAIDALGSMIPLLPYSIGPSQYTSLALIGGTSNVGLQLWNESSRDWTSAQISAQLRNSLPTTIPSGNTYGIYAIDLQTPTVFQLLPGNNSNTNTAFLVAPPSSQSSISVIFPTDEPTVSITPIGTILRPPHSKNNLFW